MKTNYQNIINENLYKLFTKPVSDLEGRLKAEKREEHYYLNAFGEECVITPDMIIFSGKPDAGPRGLLVSLYAIYAGTEALRSEPFKAFRELPDSMPFQPAFSVNSEKVLVPYVSLIKEKQEIIREALATGQSKPNVGGDFSLILRPLPKIELLYIFYEQDEEFPSSAICLFSANALSFMPVDGLADTAEYTSKAIISLIRGEHP